MSRVLSPEQWTAVHLGDRYQRLRLVISRMRLRSNRGLPPLPEDIEQVRSLKAEIRALKSGTTFVPTGPHATSYGESDKTRMAFPLRPHVENVVVSTSKPRITHG